MCLQAVHLTSVRHYSCRVRKTAFREECHDTEGMTISAMILLIVLILRVLVCAGTTLRNLGAVQPFLVCRCARVNRTSFEDSHEGIFVLGAA